MISFVNFARIASLYVGFHLGTLHGYFFHQDFWPNLNFLLEYQVKLGCQQSIFFNTMPFKEIYSAKHQQGAPLFILAGCLGVKCCLSLPTKSKQRSKRATLFEWITVVHRITVTNTRRRNTF